MEPSRDRDESFQIELTVTGDATVMDRSTNSFCRVEYRTEKHRQRGAAMSRFSGCRSGLRKAARMLKDVLHRPPTMLGGCSPPCGPELLKQVGVFDLVIPSQQQHLADDLGGLGIIIGEG